MHLHKIPQPILLFQAHNRLFNLRIHIKNLNLSVVLRLIIHPEQLLPIKVKRHRIKVKLKISNTVNLLRIKIRYRDWSSLHLILLFLLFFILRLSSNIQHTIHVVPQQRKRFLTLRSMLKLIRILNQLHRALRHKLIRVVNDSFLIPNRNVNLPPVYRMRDTSDQLL